MTTPLPEFSRIVSVSRIPPSGLEQDIEAKPAERAALAKRFDLIDMPLLKAQLTVTPGAGQSITVSGQIESDIVQNCVITLEPIKTHFDLRLNITLLPAEIHAKGAGSPDPGDLDEEVDMYEDGKIDLGETVAQHLGISIDPYPRKPDAAFGSVEFGAKVEKPQPFAELLEHQKPKQDD